jgi:hypothetical protein
MVNTERVVIGWRFWTPWVLLEGSIDFRHPLDIDALQRAGRAAMEQFSLFSKTRNFSSLLKYASKNL